MGNQLAETSLGMLFIGFTLATWLFGANTLQLYVYFQKCKDGLLLKSVVIIVFLSDMLNTIFTCWGIYLELTQTPILPLQGNVPLVLESTAADVAIFLVQCFFAQSVYQMSRQNKWLTGMIFGLATLAFAGGIALTASSITWLYLAGEALPMLTEACFASALGLVTLTDFVITVTLIRCLYNDKSFAGQTSHLLDWLILYCIQRGILTTLSHVIVIILWYSLPASNWAWTLVQFSLGKVYTLTFLTLLNRREGLKRINHDHSEPEFHMSTLQMSGTRLDDEGNETDVATTGKSVVLSMV